jgi:multisubunit Na+/H+ antiporter MnhF subunit
VNGWILAATVALGAGAGAALWGVATGPLRRRFVAQNLSTALVCLVLLLLAQGYDRPSYVDLALVLALLGPVGTLVFARLLADDLAEDPPRAGGPTYPVVGAGAAVVTALCVSFSSSARRPRTATPMRRPAPASGPRPVTGWAGSPTP